MTATILPEIVQLPFGMGNLVSGQWLAIQGLSGQATTEDIEMFARKGVFSSIGRASAVATVVAVTLTAVPPSMAFAGSASAGKGVTASTGSSDATDISARRRYYRGGVAVPLLQRRSPVSSARALRSRPPRTAATIMTAMATTAARRPITAADRPITAAPATMPAMAAVTIARRAPLSRASPRELVICGRRLNALFKMNPPAAPAGGFFYGCRPGR